MGTGGLQGAGEGLVSRLFLRRIGSRIQASWHMYPLGVLFALSFDTASEIGLLALAARAADQARQPFGRSPRSYEDPSEHQGGNMSVDQILKAHPRPLVAEAATLAACIDACASCAPMCTICADACLAEDDVRELLRCIRLCLDCADACIDAGRILSRQTEPDTDTQLTALQACLAACRSCAAECERHAHHHEHCRLCADECRRCERACEDLVAALSRA